MFGFVQITENDKAELRKLWIITAIFTLFVVIALCLYLTKQ
jgi:hypothetical protein